MAEVDSLALSMAKAAGPRDKEWSNFTRAYASTRFGQLHYWTTGEGPLLVLIHQCCHSAEEFAYAAPFLAPHFKVLAIDLPGHGESDDPDHELEVQEFGEAILAVLDHYQVL